MNLDDVNGEVARYASEIKRRLFKPGSKITILVRPPGDEEHEFLLTDDDLDDVTAAVERTKRRERQSPELVWVVTYWCRGCGGRLQMPSAAPNHMVFVGRAWCTRCGAYVSKSDAAATSKQEPKP